MRNTIITAVGLLAAPGSTMAADPNFSYTHFQAEYHLHDFDGEDGDGYQVEGSLGIGKNFFIVATVAEAGTDVNVTGTPSGDNGLFGTDVEYDFDYEISRKDVAVGLGAAWPLGNRLDLIAQAVYVESELSESLAGGRVTTDYLWTDDPTVVQSACELGLCETASTDDQGFAGSIGLRAEASERIELYGNVTYYDTDIESAFVDMNGDNMTLEAGARVSIVESLLLSLAYMKQGDVESLQAGVRIVL